MVNPNYEQAEYYAKMTRETLEADALFLYIELRKEEEKHDKTSQIKDGISERYWEAVKERNALRAQVELLNQQVGVLTERKAATDKQRERDAIAKKRKHVYFVMSRESNQIKIGISSDPKRRMRGLANDRQHALRLLRVIRGVNGRLVEGSLHKHFASSRVHGEWFFADIVLEWLQRHKSAQELRAAAVEIARRLYSQEAGIEYANGKAS